MRRLAQQSTDLLIINIVLTLIMIFICKPKLIYQNPKNDYISKKEYLFIFLLNTIHCIYAFWADDTYSIWRTFIGEHYSIEYYEAIYNWLASKTDFNYFLWRAIVWIPTLLLIYKSAQKLNLATRCFAVSFVLMNIFIVSNTRGALGHTMLLYGLILLLNDRKKNSNIILAVILIYSSYFFHKSMYINLVFAFIALFPAILNKKGFIVSIILFPLFVLIATRLIGLIQAEAVDISYGENVGGVGDRTSLYASSEAIEYSVYGIIGQFIKWMSTYIALIYISKRVVFQNYLDNIKDEKIFKYLFRLTYICIYFGAVFSMVENTSSWIGIRFRYMGMFPLPFILAKIWSLESYTNNWIKAIIITSLISIMYTYFFTYRAWM